MRIHSSSPAISRSVSRSASCGISRSSISCRTTWIRRLFSGSPGTMAGPERPPRSRSSSVETRRPPLRLRSEWHSAHFSARTGLTLVSNSWSDDWADTVRGSVTSANPTMARSATVFFMFSWGGSCEDGGPAWPHVRVRRICAVDEGFGKENGCLAGSRTVGSEPLARPQAPPGSLCCSSRSSAGAHAALPRASVAQTSIAPASAGTTARQR